MGPVTTVSVNVDPGRIARLIRLPGGIVDRDLRRRADRVAATARSLAPGSLKGAITTELTGSGRQRHAKILLNHPAAAFVTKGTRPHVIRPRTARALKFTGSGGQNVFASKTNHPGTRPNPFMVRALRAAG